MGFGFNLFFIFIFLPLLALLFLLWLITQKKIFGKTIGLVSIMLLCLVVLSGILRICMSKKVLSKGDYYGTYVIDKDLVPGKQADWQYDHYRFEIKHNDSIYFFVTNKNRILQTYSGKISTIKQYESERLVLHMPQPTHHILTTNPTIYRSAWGFTLVFNSTKFSNTFFTKGSWE